MSEYKRKKVKKSPFKKQKIKNLNEEAVLEYKEIKKPKKKPEKKAKEEKTDFFESLKLIKPEKIYKPTKPLKIIFSVLLIALLIFLVSLITPTGIIEGTSNLLKTFGSGNYPVQYNGSLTADLVSRGSYYYVLNDTSVSAFNTNGKEIFSHIHGFSNPVMSVSSERVLVFDQNGTSFNIYNLSGLIKSYTTENAIINCTISRNGSYAVATNGVEYTSTVTVFNKGNKKLYTWNSAKDIINNVALSNNGKKLAVSTLNSLGGKPVSKVSILEYDSANPVFSDDFDGKVILSLRETGSGFGCVTDSAYTYFKWNGKNKTEYSVKDKSMALLRTLGNDTLLIFNRESYKSDNHAIYLNSSGKIKGEFDYKGTITDVEIKSGKIWFLSDTDIRVYNKKGEKLLSGVCDYGIKRFSVISSDSVAGVTDDSIKEISVE